MKQRRGTKCLLFRALFGKNRHFNRRGQWPRCVLPPIPRGGVFPFTGRSPGLASSAGAPSQRFFRQWLHRFLGTRSLVCFTVAGTAPVLHRLPMLAEHARVRRRASLRTCVGCSFVTDIIHADGALVNLLRFLDTFPAICYNSDGRNRTCGFHPFSLYIISHTRCDFPCARGVSPCNKSHQQT